MVTTTASNYPGWIWGVENIGLGLKYLWLQRRSWSDLDLDLHPDQYHFYTPKSEYQAYIGYLQEQCDSTDPGTCLNMLKVRKEGSNARIHVFWCFRSSTHNLQVYSLRKYKVCVLEQRVTSSNSISSVNGQPEGLSNILANWSLTIWLIKDFVLLIKLQECSCGAIESVERVRRRTSDTTTGAVKAPKWFQER